MKIEALPIASLALVSSGGSAPQDPDAFSESGHPFVRAGSLPKLLNGIGEHQLEKLKPEIAAQYGLKLFPEGTVLFAKSGMSATKGHIYRLKGSAYVVSHLAALVPHDQRDSGYLVRALAMYPPTSLIRDPAYPSIRLSDIEGFRIEGPNDVVERSRIAAILDQANELRRKRREALEKANTLTEAIFLDAFGDPIKNIRGYPTKALRQLVDPKRGISYGVVQRGDDQDSGVPIIRISDVVEGEIDARNLKMTRLEIAAKFKRTKLVGGEIVVSIRGTIGRCAIVPLTLVGGNVSREIAVIPTIFPELNEFYVALLRCRAVQARLTRDVKGIAQQGINLEDLWELPVIQPGQEELRAFLGNYAAVISMLKNHRAHLAKLDALFSSLQYQAFRGEL